LSKVDLLREVQAEHISSCLWSILSVSQISVLEMQLLSSIAEQGAARTWLGILYFHGWGNRLKRICERYEPGLNVDYAS